MNSQEIDAMYAIVADAELGRRVGALVIDWAWQRKRGNNPAGIDPAWIDSIIHNGPDALVPGFLWAVATNSSTRGSYVAFSRVSDADLEYVVITEALPVLAPAPEAA